MILARAYFQRILPQSRAFRSHAHRSFGDPAELHDAFGNQIHSFFSRVSYVIKELV